MSEIKTKTLEGRDGRLYRIPVDTLKEYELSPKEVMALKDAMGEAATGAGASPVVQPAPTASSAALDEEQPNLGALPRDHPGYHQQQAILAAVAAAKKEAGGGVTLHFHFNGVSAPNVAVNTDGGIEGYHMDFDESGMPVAHTDMKWGDYIDKQGTAAVGFHSHDPVTGNAQ